MREINNEDVLKYNLRPIKQVSKRESTGKTGFRTSLNLQHLENKKQRTTIYNKRSDGLIKKTVQLMELTRAPLLLFIQNPDTLSLCLTKSHSMNIQSNFCLIGHLIKLFFDLHKIDNSEFEEIQEKVVEKLKNEDNFKIFINCLRDFVNQ